MPAAALQAGDRLLVRPGDRVPADGIVLIGHAPRSTKAWSPARPRAARSRRARRSTPAAVNFSGTLTMRVTAAGSGTLIDEVERLLRQGRRGEIALSCGSPTARRALYAPVVHATAALTLVGWLVAGASVHDAIITAIAVLIITCPCALALAIPAVQVVASGALFRAGVILNAGDAIERLAEVDTVVFDKTGTLTLPEPRVVNAARSTPDLLETAARLALSSRHPLAAAVAREARERMPFDGARRGAGTGRARHDRRHRGAARQPGLLRASDDRPRRIEPGTSADRIQPHAGRAAVLAVRQALRRDAVETATALRALGLDLDDPVGRPRRMRSRRSQRALGIADWRGGLTPAEKIAAIDDAEGAAAAAC